MVWWMRLYKKLRRPPPTRNKRSKHEHNQESRWFRPLVGTRYALESQGREFSSDN